MERTSCSVRIKAALNENGLKPADLCKMTGISKSTMSQYINGVYIPSQLRAKLISDKLNVSTAWLMGFDVPMDTDFTQEFLLAKSYFGVLMTREEMGIAKSKAYDILGSNQYSEDEKYSAAIKLIESYFSRSLYANQLKHSHPPFNKYVAMLVNNEEWKEPFSEPIYQKLVAAYGKLPGLHGKETTISDDGGITEEDLDIAIAYHNANDGIQSSVRKLLDVDDTATPTPSP